MNSEKKQQPKETEPHPKLSRDQQERQLDIYWQKVKKHAALQVERARQIKEAKQQKKAKVQNQGQPQLPPALTKKQLKKQERREAGERKRLEEEAELARLRGCEKELMALRVAQARFLARGTAMNPTPISPPLTSDDQAERPSMTPNRVKLLKRAREGQEPQEDIQHEPVQSDPAASTLVKEEPTESSVAPVPEHVIANEEELERAHEVPDIQALESESEDEDKEFSFELVVDLKGIGKRGRRDTSPGPSSPANNGLESMPTITKVAIALESTTEYRISVSGERPKKRPRN
ncbi:hypothetical protein AN958_11895 [Leucoagaricus sp. SymC.cos]|nr:hypothetical protein AN958_11895 [Leucoagaricus sp. SymC.cos]